MSDLNLTELRVIVENSITDWEEGRSMWSPPTVWLDASTVLALIDTVETHYEIVGRHRDRQLSYVEELKRLRGVVEKVSKYADDRAAHTRGICHSVRVASDLRAILEGLDVGDSGV